MDSSLVQVLTLGGNPMLHAVVVLSAIVSIIRYFKKAADVNGSHHEGVMELVMIILGTYLLCAIITLVKTKANSITISGIDFSAMEFLCINRFSYYKQTLFTNSKEGKE